MGWGEGKNALAANYEINLPDCPQKEVSIRGGGEGVGRGWGVKGMLNKVLIPLGQTRDERYLMSSSYLFFVKELILICSMKDKLQL